MGANEKHAATYHGGEYTPSLGVVRESFALTRKGPLKSNSGATAYAEFDRMIAKVRAEAKAEALNEAATELNRLDTDVEMYDENLRATQVEWWLRARANQYKEEPANGR